MAKKGSLTTRVGAANTWLSLIDRLWKVTGYLGITGWLSATVGLGLFAWFWVAVDFVTALPWYLLLLIALLFATLCLHFYNKARIAWSLRGVKSFDIEEFAEECQAYYRDFADYMVSRQDARPVHHRDSNDRDDSYKKWQDDVAHSMKSDALVMARFGPRAYSIAHRMTGLGIKPPNLFHFPHGDHGGVGVYIGLVGDLLKKGLLEEARKQDPQITWGASFR